MRLVVFGATGGTGQAAVTQALGHGDTVTAFVRDPSRLPIAHERLRVVQGDVLDAEAVAAVVEGQDAVVSALGQAGRRVRVYSEGIRNILSAMEAADVYRIVCVSAAGVGAPGGGGLPAWYSKLIVPLFLREVYADMKLMEDAVMASETYWTIVRPAGLTDGPFTGVYRVVVGDGVPKGRTISRTDLAAFLLKALGQAAYVRQAVAIAY